MGANMSECCQREPRLEVGKQAVDNQAPRSAISFSMIERGLAKASQHADQAPEEMAPEEMAQRLQALKKYQADLKAKKEAGWKDKWQQADNARQTLQQQLAEASSAQQDKPKRQPVKFERSFSMQKAGNGKPLKRGSSKSWHQALMSGSSKNVSA